MPTTGTIRHLRLFVASPGDVGAERDRIPKLVERLNKTVARREGLHLDLWRWEDDAVPGLGAEPQALIDPAVGKADIVVVILWNRFGSPTAKFDSGTEEELTLALERWRATGTPEVMAYFCQRPANLTTIGDLQQKQKVLELRARLRENALFCDYAEVDEFADKLQDHLAIKLRGFATQAAAPAKPPAPAATLARSDTERYLRHVANEYDSIRLIGLLGDKAAPPVPLEDVYVSLVARRPDVGDFDGELRNAPGPEREEATGIELAGESEQELPVLELSRVLASDEPEPAPALIARALCFVGVPAEEAANADTVAAIGDRLKRLGEKPSEAAVQRVLQTVSIEEALRRASHVLIEGDPGSGKSTALQHVAMALVHARRDDSGAAVAMGFRKPFPLPVLVPLRRFAAWLARLAAEKRDGADGKSLLHYLQSTVEERAGTDAWLEPALREGRVAVLLDGLDEVADDVLRPRVAIIVQGFVQEFKACRFVVTSRPAGLTGTVRRSLRDLCLTHIEPLDDQQIDRFVRAWYRALIKDERLARERAEDLLQRIQASPRVRALTTTPILLTAIAVVHQTMGNLPERRAELYEHCVNALAHRWFATQEGGEALCGPLSLHAKRAMFQEIAIALQRQGSDEASLDSRDALAIVKRNLPRDRDFPDDDDTCMSLLGSMAERSGLIIPSGRSYRFRHPTFREFLAARWLCDRTSDPVRELTAHLADPWWREVVQLVVGYTVLGSEARARELLVRLVEAASVIPEPDKKVYALGTVARALVDLREFDVDFTEPAPLITPALAEVLRDEAQPGDARERMAIAEALGWMGDTRLSDDQRWVTVPPGRYWRGEDADDWAEVGAYRVGRWPVTRGEYRDFMQDGGYDTRQWWKDAGWKTRSKKGWKAPENWEEDAGLSPNHPVIGVSFYEAEAYCRWLSARLRASGALPEDAEVRLPTDDEWGKAARGGELLSDGSDNPAPKRDYPWGDDEDDARHANGRALGLGRVVPVGCFPAGNGAYGTWDQAGNVWEWCAGRAVRGGSCWDSALRLRVSYRNRRRLADRIGNPGFRCVVAPARAV